MLTLVAANLAALAVRAWFVVWSGPFAATTGFEEFCLYNVWKVLHDLPLYEWPQREPFLLTSYNAGFYHVYAAWARLWGADGAGLVVCTRGLTLLWTVAAMALQAHLLRWVVPECGRAWRWGLAFLVWFGTSFSAWSPLTARPDVAAVALALAGLAFALRAQDTGRARWWWLASLAFVGAWSFKQSVVWIFAGSIVQAGVARCGWKNFLRLTAPFAGLAAAVLAVGDAAYRYNLFVVPGVYRWMPLQSVELLAKTISANPFFWAFGAVAFVTTWRTGVHPTAGAAEARATARLRALAIVATPPLLMGVGQLALHGSSTNNLLEGFALLGLLAGAAWSRVWHDESAARARVIGAVLLASMAVLPAAQLGQAACGVPETKLGDVSIGNLTKLTAEQLSQRRQFAAWLATQPKPLWIRDAMLQLPWFANDNRYPAFPYDYEFEADASRRGVLAGDGFSELFRARRFATVLLWPDDGFFLHGAQNAGYVEAPLPEGFSPLATEFGVFRPAPRLLHRTVPP